MSTSKENLSHTSGLVIDVMRNGPGRINANDRGPSYRNGPMGNNYGGNSYGSSYGSSGGPPPRGYGHQNMYQNSYPGYNSEQGFGGRYNQNHGGYQQGYQPNNYYGGGMHQQQTPNYGQAPRPPAPASSTEWIKYETDQGMPYWYNTRTNITQWENPGA